MRLILFGMLAFAGSLPTGSPWPVTEGETLSGTKLSLPSAAQGKPALIVMTFSKEAGEASKPWCTRILKDFPPAQLNQIAMLEKAPRLVRGLIRRGMRGDMPTNLHARTILLYQGDAEWRQRLGIGNDRLPIVVVLDAQGRIAAQYAGNFDESQYQKLRTNAL